MHGFRANEVLVLTKYDVIMIFPLEGTLGNILWRILNEHDFLKVFHSNVLSGMHGFRANKVLLQAGNDVIVIFPLGGASGDFSWRILKEGLWLPNSVPR